MHRIRRSRSLVLFLTTAFTLLMGGCGGSLMDTSNDQAMKWKDEMNFIATKTHNIKDVLANPLSFKTMSSKEKGHQVSYDGKTFLITRLIPHPKNKNHWSMLLTKQFERDSHVHVQTLTMDVDPEFFCKKAGEDQICHPYEGYTTTFGVFIHINRDDEIVKNIPFVLNKDGDIVSNGIIVSKIKSDGFVEVAGVRTYDEYKREYLKDGYTYLKPDICQGGQNSENSCRAFTNDRSFFAGVKSTISDYCRGNRVWCVTVVIITAAVAAEMIFGGGSSKRRTPAAAAPSAGEACDLGLAPGTAGSCN